MDETYSVLNNVSFTTKISNMFIDYILKLKWLKIKERYSEPTDCSKLTNIN